MLDLVGDIYATATDPAQWYPTLERLCEAFGARAAGLRFEDQGATGVQQIWTGLEPEFEAAYVEHYWRTDPWVNVNTAADVGDAIASDALVPRAQLERTEFYRGMCVPFELDDLLGAVIERSDRRLVTLGLMKQARGHTFDRDSSRDLRVLLPHVQRSLQLASRLAAAQPGGSLAWHLVDQLPVAILVVAQSGRVARVNRAAELLFGDGLALELGRLTATLDPAPFRRQLGEVLDGCAPSGPLTIAIPRPSGKASYQATIIPIGAGDALLDGIAAPAALIAVTDPEAAIDPPAQLLGVRFGLTPVEAQVALRIARGAAPPEVATELGLPPATVGFLLRQVCSKTGTTSAGALARLLVLLGRS